MHIDCVKESKLHVNLQFISVESRWLRERNILQSLFDSEKVSNSPLFWDDLAILWILVELEVDDSTNYIVVLNTILSEVVVACPETSEDDLHI